MRFFVFLFALFCAAPVWADDRGVLQAFLEDNLSDAGREVRITGFEGALSSKAKIAEMTIADTQGVWLTLQGLSLDWSRAALLRGRLQVAALQAETITLARLPVAPEVSVAQSQARAFALPELPVSIDIAQISAHRVHLGAPVLGQAVSLQIDGALSLADGAGQASLNLTRRDGPAGRFALSAGFANDTGQLQLALDLTEDQGGLVASLAGIPDTPPVSLRVAGDAPLSDFAATLDLSTSGQSRLTGDVVIRNDGAGTQQVEGQIAGDVRPLFAPDLRAFFGPVAQAQFAAVRSADGGLNLPQITLSTQQLQVDGALSLTPDGMPNLVSLHIETQADAAIVLPLAGPRTRLESAVADLRFDAAQGDLWQLRSALRGVSRGGVDLGMLSLQGDGTIDVANAAVTGDLNARATGLSFADAAMMAAIGSAVEARVAANWAKDAPLQIDAASLVAGTTTLTGQAALDGAQLTGTAGFESPELSRFSGLAGRELGGRASFDVSGAYNLLSGAFDAFVEGLSDNLSIGEPRVDALTAGIGVLSLSGVRDISGTELRHLQITTPQAAIDAQGRLSVQTGDATLTAELPDLSVVDNRVDGPGTVSAELAWSAGAPIRVRQLNARAMGATVDGNGQVLRENGSVSARGSVALTAPDLSRWSRLAGRPLGGSASAKVSGRIEGDDGAVQLTLTGQDISAGIDGLDALTRGATTFKANAIQTGGVLASCDATLTSDEVSANINCAGPNEIAFDTRLRNLAVLAPGFPGAATVNGTATRAGALWQVATDLSGPGGSTLRATGRVDPTGAGNDLRVTGAVPLGLANPMIAPQSVTGRANLDLSLRGALSLNAVSGSLRTADARLAVPSVQLALQGIDATLDLTAGQARIVASGGLSQGGRVGVSGTLGLTAQQADLDITLDNARLRRDPLFDARADAQLRFSGPLNSAVLSGDVTLTEAELRVPSGTSAANGYVPDGLRHVGAPSAVRRSYTAAGIGQSGGGGPAIALNVNVAAPGRVFVRGRGLDAELGGQLQLGGTTQNVVPAGQFDLIRGRLDLLGRRLTMREGVITLQGALEPHLHLLAAARADDFDVTVGLDGPASAPKLSFAAEPALPEDEALAVLLFGRRIETLSPLQAAQLAGAVATLAGRGDGIVGRLRLGFGLDDLDIASDGQGGTALSAGKYLSENIYTDITIGSDGRSQVNLNLDVAPNVTATGRLGSDGQSGVGLFWQRDY